MSIVGKLMSIVIYAEGFISTPPILILKPSDNMTYLGIILDQKLNWSLHIKTKVSKAIK